MRATVKAIALILAAAACSHARSHSGGDDDTTADAAIAPGDPDAPASTATDPFPTGAISLFLATGCPMGWKPYEDAAGRTLIGQTADPHVAVGAPLARNEERAHHHDASVAVDLPKVSYVGVAGGGNSGVAAAGHVASTVVTADADPTLPYVQLLVCKKTGDAAATRVPSGLVAYFDAGACPAGWSDAPAAIVGRVAIGVPPGGTPGATFGGAPLASGETRTHTHPITATVALPSHGIALISGCCADGYGQSGDRAVGGTTTPAAVELPYLQLRACAKA